jgi:hypothetical protein
MKSRQVYREGHGRCLSGGVKGGEASPDEPPERASAVWSWREESNLQPAVYKTAALPIELRQPAGERCDEHVKNSRTVSIGRRACQEMPAPGPL